MRATARVALTDPVRYTPATVTVTVAVTGDEEDLVSPARLDVADSADLLLRKVR